MKHYRLKKKIANIITPIIITIFLLSIFEFTFFVLRQYKTETNYLKKTNFGDKNFFENMYMIDENIGLKGKLNQIVNASKYLNNRTILYTAIYTLDEYGRRKTFGEVEDPHLILFGGSFTFGEGLNDSQTLGYFLSENHSVYNYAFPGYGTSQMLAFLEEDDIDKQIAKKTGKAIYIFIPNHIRRNIGDMQMYNHGCKHAPYYFLDKKDVLVRRKLFTNGRPLISFLYSLIYKSNFVNYMDLNYPKEKEDHLLLTAKLIEESKKIYEQKFDGEFYVLMHPFYFDDPAVIKLEEILEDRNISVIKYTLPGEMENYRIPNDLHPNETLNEKLAEKILGDIN